MRLFVAILLSDKVRSTLQRLQGKLRRSSEGVRWVLPDQLHLTTKFLGDVPDRDVPAVCDAFTESTVGVDRFEMTLADCGCFPERGPVKIVWAGVQEPSGTLARFVDALEDQMEDVGFPKERRPFTPHITIGRVRVDRSDGAIRTAIETGSLAPLPQPVSSVTLMSSVLSPKGPTYTPAATEKLGRKNNV